MLGLKHAFIPDVQPLASSTPVAELFGPWRPAFPLPVVDEDGSLGGSVAPPCSFLDAHPAGAAAPDRSAAHPAESEVPACGGTRRGAACPAAAPVHNQTGDAA
jgi:glycine betaine/proline transport system ATP-binding protein